MKIKKVDDKPMVIHTKKKMNIHKAEAVKDMKTKAVSHTFIITKHDSLTPHSCTLKSFEDTIVVPAEPSTYQYLVCTDSKFEENIIVYGIIHEIYLHCHDFEIHIDFELCSSYKITKLLSRVPFETM